MKLRFSFMLTSLLMTAALLTGCYNRIQEFQPYSSFDDRMSEVNDDSEPVRNNSPYALEQESGGSHSTRSHKAETASSKQAARQAKVLESREVEVPFSDSRSPEGKQPVNIGALD